MKRSLGSRRFSSRVCLFLAVFVKRTGRYFSNPIRCDPIWSGYRHLMIKSDFQRIRKTNYKLMRLIFKIVHILQLAKPGFFFWFFFFLHIAEHYCLIITNA